MVFDAWAVLALLLDEPSAARVEEAWRRETPMISSVNLGEVLYALIRTEGDKAARRTVEKIRARVTVVDPDWRLVGAAAEIKAGGGLSYADCFALATARLHGLPLWTGDPELIARAADGEVVDLR